MKVLIILKISSNSKFLVSKPGTVNEDLEVATAFSSSQTIENCLDCAVTTTVNNKKVKNKDIFMDYNNANFYGVVFVKTTKTKLSIYTNLNLFSFF